MLQEMSWYHRANVPRQNIWFNVAEQHLLHPLFLLCSTCFSPYTLESPVVLTEADVCRSLMEAGRLIRHAFAKPTSLSPSVFAFKLKNMVWKHFWWSGTVGQLLRLIMVHRDVLTHCCSLRLEGWWHPLEKGHSRLSQHQRAPSSLENIFQTQLPDVLSCSQPASFGHCNHCMKDT